MLRQWWELFSQKHKLPSDKTAKRKVSLVSQLVLEFAIELIQNYLQDS